MRVFKNKFQMKRKQYKALIALLFILPGLIYYLLFRYVPIWGNVIAFFDYNPYVGLTDSKFVGFKHFIYFFTSKYFWRLLRNTFLLSFYSIIFSFPLPILFALLLSEVKFNKYRSVIQCISYIPHFISVVVICGILKDFLSLDHGVINEIISALGGTKINFFQDSDWFRTIYIGSDVWQGVGWSSIIYYATLTSVDPTFYEAARLDGANRLQRIRYISLPFLKPTITVLLLMSLGKILNVGFEKVLLLQNSSTYETSDIISTYVYRMGIQQMQLSFSTAVGFFNNVVGLSLLIVSNMISKKFSETSLW